MRKLLFLLVLFSCKKNDTKPTPAPTPTPVPVDTRAKYLFNINCKGAVYTQTTFPTTASDPRDSVFFTVTNKNLSIYSRGFPRMSNSLGITPADTIRTGDTVRFITRMITYTKHAKECTLSVDKAWFRKMDNSEIVLVTNNSVKVPVVYSVINGDSIGEALHTKTFVAP